MKTTRQQQQILNVLSNPNYANQVLNNNHKSGKYVTFTFKRNDKDAFGIAKWRGKQVKPTLQGYLNKEERDEAKTSLLNWYLKWDKEREETAKKQKELINTIKEGDIFYTCWGYEQTNVEFYQVIERKGITVTIRELCQDRTYTNDMQGTTKPIPNKFYGEPFKKRITKRGDLKISQCITAWLCTDEERSYSWSSYY